MTIQMASNETGEGLDEWRVSSEELQEFATQALMAVHTSPDAARSVSAALAEASLRGVDSHGIRLLPHYVKVVQAGRVNPTAQLSFRLIAPAAGIVNANHGFGHYASFFAIDHAMVLARENGIAAISVVNSSHFGAAGCYALRAALQGFVGIALSNSDSFVLPHNGIRSFNGTNPLAFAAPNPGSRPLLVDMATSVVPWNRVQDLMNEGKRLPFDVAVDKAGEVTDDPAESASLLPLGGVQFGYKGAAIASMIEILSSVMSGMPHCSQIPPMRGPDFSTPRRLGHYFIVIDCRRLLSDELYKSGIAAYLEDLRTQQAKQGQCVMAPGDKEWSAVTDRTRFGIPIPRHLRSDLDALADQLRLSRIEYESAAFEHSDSLSDVGR
jgi:ureidoglycolate dehydrogenase (NAD+)